MRNLLTLAMVAVVCAACTSHSTEHAPRTERAPRTNPAVVARMLVASYGPSTGTRYQDVRCAHVVGLSAGNYACTLELVGLRRQSDEFAATAVTIANGRIVSSGGLADVGQTCFQTSDCWGQMLATTTCTTCSAAPFIGPLEPAHEMMTMPRTVDQCIAGWNIHGGFAPVDTADPQVVALPTQAVAKPVYTPYLAPTSMGYLAARVSVEPVGTGCAVDVDTGGRAYRISTPGGPDPWTWLWQGAEGLSHPPATWNACQNRDGTIAASGCSSGAGVPQRNILDELHRGPLAQMASVGGFPYWLGMPFGGAMPEAQDEGNVLVVRYDGVADGARRLGITIYTALGSQIRPTSVDGQVVLRVHPDSGIVVVTSAQPVSASLRHVIARTIRPFTPIDPGAPQKPGDVSPTRSRVDSHAPSRPLGFGHAVGGLEAVVETDSPAGVGVVRYGPTGESRTFYVITYRPIVSNCGTLGCASPPPLPPVLRRYGKDTHQTWIMNDMITTILAAHPSLIPPVPPTSTPRPVT